jgi:hypothetical protein
VRAQLVASALVTCLAASLAHADVPVDAPVDAPAQGRAAAPEDLVGERLVLPARTLEVRLTWEVELQRGRHTRPLSLAPDLWVGLTDRWTIGLTHSNASVDRIDTGATFCVREHASACDRVYRGSHLDVRWSWREGGLAVAPRARLLVRDISPWKPAVTVGGLVRFTRGRFRIASDPYLRLPLANADQGNRAALMLPVWLGVQPARRWLLELHTGYDGELAVWPDGWHIPFALVTRVRPASQLELALEAGFSSLFGPQNNIKQRAVMLSVGWRGGV